MSVPSIPVPIAPVAKPKKHFIGAAAPAGYVAGVGRGYKFIFKLF